MTVRRRKPVAVVPPKRVRKALTSEDRANRVLTAIDKVLAGKDQLAARYVWDVLSGGVRGPDTRSWAEKDAYTLPLRRRAFPLTAAANDRGEKIAGNRPSFRRSDANFSLHVRDVHFREHGLNAYAALMSLGRL